MERIPELKREARRLVFLCLFIIFIYTVGAYLTVSPPSPFLAIEFLQNTLAGVVISLGGGLLLDIEIRATERKK